ncbi:MAG: very short patch repair endonuclease [Rhodanobacter sp.]
MDIVDRSTRSRMMSGIRGKDTKPELLIRRGLHALGYRYRLHHPGLPGRPDLVLARHKAVVFVHGCFWHGHDCSLFRLPSTRTNFWKDKIRGNHERDDCAVANLMSQGWRVAVVWECALRGAGARPEQVIRQIAGWLETEQPWIEVRG